MIYLLGIYLMCDFSYILLIFEAYFSIFGYDIERGLFSKTMMEIVTYIARRCDISQTQQPAILTREVLMCSPHELCCGVISSFPCF